MNCRGTTMPRKRALTFNAETFLKKIGKRKTSRKYRNKEIVFSQGDAADSMFYVEAGNVKLTVLSKRGEKAVIAIFRRGDFFGDSCLGALSIGCPPRQRYTQPRLREWKRRPSFASSMKTLCSQGYLLRISFFALSELKRTSSTNSSIPAKGGWHELFYCWRALGRNPSRIPPN